jgi:phage replication-related protein YjqB (UPF0714/DUF867 family)
LLAASPLVITIHGEDSDDEAVFIGGLAGELRKAVEDSLKAAGFGVERHANPALQGDSRESILQSGHSTSGCSA